MITVISINIDKVSGFPNIVFIGYTLQTDKSRHLLFIILFSSSISLYFLSSLFVYVYLNSPFFFVSHEFLVHVKLR